MKEVIKVGALTAVILTLTVLTARCALIGDEVAAVEPTRIEAPRDEWVHDYAARSSTTEAEAETLEVIAQIPALEVASPALELMYDLPLRAEVQLEVEAMCAARDIDVAVVLGIIYVESRYDEGAVGDYCESYGLMQVQPKWHGDRMTRLGATNLLDGVQNVTVGIDYLDELLDRYDGDYLAALTAYNAGHYSGTVSAYAYEVMETAKQINS